MDLASVLAARALDVRPGDQVLDLCAAPGGKTLVLAARLGDGSLVANDRSAARRRRLRRVLDLYLPPELRARVRVTGHDARRWGLHEPARYDRILLDAPCSTDRHVLADPAALARWSPARPRQLCTLQRAMLASALDALRPGGTLVYATCSLCPEENDGAIAWLHRKRPGRFEVLEPGGSRGSPTEFGCFLRPDRDGGSGPLYFARLRRRA
ncbi:MAG: RsmB/NOP family class I SAM-dependent RNA methyltransferase [Deltaproteobacteria bacterium]|nr:MAG: RsmB/NOP family class I SAM-dependent RNA methyltransferase [Deltaproteobacteria bacterium]